MAASIMGKAFNRHIFIHHQPPQTTTVQIAPTILSRLQLILLSKINQQIEIYFLSCFSSTMSAAPNYSTFQVSGDESKYVHPTNFSYFQFPEDHQTS